MSTIALDIQNVFKYFGTVQAVNGVSFSVPRGTCFGLLGPNGAGKTTLIKTLYGMSRRDKPDQSSISIFGFDPLYNELEIKYISGIVQQEDNLDVELSVYQNLFIYSKFYGIPKKTANKRINELLTFMELHEKRDTRIKELSGGMKRRLTIVRALLNEPRLLFLDEPTTGLDPQVRHIIWDKIRLLKKNGVTILLTTHYMEEAFQICDNLMIMNNGKKVMEGNPGKLISENIEAYVLEVYNADSVNLSQKTGNIRKEETGDRLLLYADNIQVLENVCNKTCDAGEFYLRQSNLEDLFLKVTGRNLNE